MQTPPTPNLNQSNLSSDPFAQFETWYQQAIDNDLVQPNAMDLATAAAGGRVSSRIVLLRMFDQYGFVFFTGTATQKAHDIAANAQVALLFSWLPLKRQVRIQGTAVALATAESIRYFASRPRGSQLGAWLTQSSTVVSSRQMLVAKMSELKRKFQDGKVPFPDNWGGYQVRPDYFEFWQAAPDGIPDRFAYTLETDRSWQRQRLNP